MTVSLQKVPGYLFGNKQPTALLKFNTQKPLDAKTERALDALLTLTKSTQPKYFPTSGDDIIPSKLVTLIAHLASLCGDQRFTPVTITRDGDILSYALPTLNLSMIDMTLRMLNRLLQRLTPKSSKKATINILNTHLEKMRRLMPGGTNAANFIWAAANHNLPFQIFENRQLLLGYGSGSFMFNSSITDKESAIGVGMAKSKATTNAYLSLSGYPVTQQAQIKTIEQAKSFVAKFGYPVVLKPANEEQGRGIFAHIKTDDDLLDCFKQLEGRYKWILIEQHVPGDQYRIDFVEDMLVKAVKRTAPHITGDGKHSIRELVAILNKDPERLDPASSKRTVLIDADLERCLRVQNVTLDTIPETGKRYFLKSISNLSRGGSQVFVEDKIHPENYAMIKSVIRTMRLRIAGVDFLSPDASVPWYENGAKICEVNAQPQMGKSKTDVYWKTLDAYRKPLPDIHVTVSPETNHQYTGLFDTEQETITLTLSPDYLIKNGMPTQYFTSLNYDDQVSQEDREKLDRILVSVR